VRQGPEDTYAYSTVFPWPVPVPVLSCPVSCSLRYSSHRNLRRLTVSENLRKDRRLQSPIETLLNYLPTPLPLIIACVLFSFLFLFFFPPFPLLSPLSSLSILWFLEPRCYPKSSRPNAWPPLLTSVISCSAVLHIVAPPPFPSRIAPALLLFNQHHLD
jgi:hypothetical protein